jgi:hypothetical protein
MGDYRDVSEAIISKDCGSRLERNLSFDRRPCQHGLNLGESIAVRRRSALEHRIADGGTAQAISLMAF